MSRPPLWCCQDCKRPLGQIVAGDLDVFGRSTIKMGHAEVPCSCGAVRVWYASDAPEAQQPFESYADWLNRTGEPDPEPGVFDAIVTRGKDPEWEDATP